MTDDHVVTLVAPSGAASLAGAVDSVRAMLRTVGAEPGRPDWLSPGRACDLPIRGADAGALAAPLNAHLEGFAIDHAIHPAAGRRKSLLVADMESTIIRQELLVEMGLRAGLGERIAGITERAMRGEVGFAEALRERVALLAGMSIDNLVALRAEIELMPGARSLVVTMRRHGARALLVTGGFAEFAEPVASLCGFDDVRCNRLEIAEGRLTGRLAGPIIDAAGKQEHLLCACAEAGIAPAEAVAVGDGANDIPMLLAAGMGVAYHGKPAVRAAARWRVDHGDLTAILYYQGYRDGDIVS